MKTSTLDIVPVHTPAELEEFIKLPYSLHKDDPLWIPPLLMERRDLLDPKKNPFMKRAEVQFWLAKRDGVAVGRISAQLDPLTAKQRGPGEGHFGLIDGEDDPAIFEALTKTAEDWLRARGATVVYGPFNLNINQEAGLLVDGHETPPMMLMGHDFPHVDTHLNGLGYDKVRDLHAFEWKFGDELPKMLKAFEKRGLSENMVVRPINMKKYQEEIRILGDIFNDGWSENWGFVPMVEEEIAHMAKELKPVIDPKMFWFVEVDGEPAAFIVGVPNVNEAIADLQGKLLPFGWAKLLWRLKVKGLKTVRVPLLGVRKKHQATVLGPRIVGNLMLKIHKAQEDRGTETLEMSWVLEDNHAMISLAGKMGGRHYKTYRVYQKSLT